ncbi:MAG: hypothetical protein ACLGJB_03785 [Blastocatellia bacterium]
MATDATHIDKYILVGKKVKPVEDVLEWEEYLEGDDRIVKQETLPNGKYVSTVFLGLDHSFGDGPPLLYETMVFPSKGNYSEIDVDRYSTWKEAQAGHKRMVEKYS